LSNAWCPAIPSAGPATASSDPITAERRRASDTQPRDSAVPAPAPAATAIDEVVAGMQAIDAALAADDGVACFNRMYLQVTRGVSQLVQQGSFGDAGFVSHLDVVRPE